MKEVTAAIMIKSNKVLIAQRTASETLAGAWEFPGGKIEKNETPEECLQRELYEELNIKTKVKEFFAENIYEYPQGAIHLLAYYVDIISGEITLTVHDEYRWVPVNELLNYKLLPADIPIAQKIIEVLK